MGAGRDRSRVYLGCMGARVLNREPRGEVSKSYWQGNQILTVCTMPL